MLFYATWKAPCPYCHNAHEDACVDNATLWYIGKVHDAKTTAHHGQHEVFHPVGEHTLFVPVC